MKDYIKKNIVFASHVALINGKEYDGIGNVIKATLDNMVDEYTFVRNSIDGLLSSEIQTYRRGYIVESVDLGALTHPSPLRYLSEIFRTVKYFSRHQPIDVYIGIDPLNALAGIILKKRKKVKKAIFYTADYSPKRFENPVLNKAYHLIDRYCVSNADEVWSVSTRICAVRRNMGLPDEKNIFIPNVPPENFDILETAEHDKYELITTGIVDKQLDFKGSIQAVAELAEEFSELHLTIIGNGPEEGNLKNWIKELGVEHKITLTGRLPLDDALKAQSRAGIGLALYTGIWGFNEYGDSTKCREYFNFGLPVISTDTHSTVEDIQKWKAGIIVNTSVEEYKAAIRTLLSNYEEYSQRSREAGDEYRGIHKKLLVRALNDKI
jgi:glycosyltransferase involved in cell wall biosynthesis